MLYFWQGRNSSQDEKAAVALFAKDLDDKLGGDPVQVRVVQNKEPDHFLAVCLALPRPGPPPPLPPACLVTCVLVTCVATRESGAARTD